MLMRTFFIMTMVILGCWDSVLAQNPKSERIKEIRSAYAKAKDKIDKNGKNGRSPHDMSIIINNVADEEAEITSEDHLDFYFDERVAEDGNHPKQLFFVAGNSSLHGNSKYCEWLYDTDGNLMFSYMKAETDAGYVVESRYYYDTSGKCIEQKHNTPNTWTSEKEELEKADRLLKLFKMTTSGEDLTPYPDHEDGVKPYTDQQMKHIREIYAQAKDKIAKNDKSSTPRDATITVHDLGEDWPPRTITTQFFFETVNDEDDCCYFISQHNRSMSFDQYSEYLFEPQTNNLIFSYYRSREEGEQYETRYYFDEKGRCIEVKSDEEETDYGYLSRHLANDLLFLFRAISQ